MLQSKGISCCQKVCFPRKGERFARILCWLGGFVLTKMANFAPCGTASAVVSARTPERGKIDKKGLLCFFYQ